MPRNNQQDTASWDAREVRRAGEQRPREKRRRRVRLVPYLLFVVVVSAILAGSGWLLVSEFCSFNRAPVEAKYRKCRLAGKRVTDLLKTCASTPFP